MLHKLWSLAPVLIRVNLFGLFIDLGMNVVNGGVEVVTHEAMRSELAVVTTMLMTLTGRYASGRERIERR